MPKENQEFIIAFQKLKEKKNKNNPNNLLMTSLAAKISLHTSKPNLSFSGGSLSYLIIKAYPIVIITKKLFRKVLKISRKVVVRAFF